MCFYHFQILDLIFDQNRQQQHNETLRLIQPVDETTMDPIPSEMRCKKEILNIVVLQMIAHDTPFLRCQADRQTVLLDLDFE